MRLDHIFFAPCVQCGFEKSDRVQNIELLKISFDLCKVLSASAGRHERKLWCRVPGGHRSRATPVPIPNTEVKPATADGTVWETAWESRSLPGVFVKKPDVRNRVGLFAVPK